MKQKTVWVFLFRWGDKKNNINIPKDFSLWDHVPSDIHLYRFKKCMRKKMHTTPIQPEGEEIAQ